MLSIEDLRGRELSARALRETLPRAELDVEAALDVVRPICEDVRHRGAAALLELGERLDGVRPPSLRVPVEVLALAAEQLDPDVRRALEVAIERARLVHRAQRRQDVTVQVVPGGTVTERWVPVERVGLYVPGGLAVYPSSVVMNVVPAQEAGVGSSPSRARRSARGSAASRGCRTPPSSRPATCSASRRCMPSAAPRPSRCSPTARPPTRRWTPRPSSPPPW